MRMVTISMCAVFFVSVAVCLLSMSMQTRAIKELEELRISAVRELETGDMDGLKTAIGVLEERFHRYSRRLEFIASHTDLHDVRICLVDARISLQYGDGDDAGQALAQMGEALGHILDIEKISLKNII